MPGDVAKGSVAPPSGGDGTGAPLAGDECVGCGIGFIVDAATGANVLAVLTDTPVVDPEDPGVLLCPECDTDADRIKYRLTAAVLTEVLNAAGDTAAIGFACAMLGAAIDIRTYDPATETPECPTVDEVVCPPGCVIDDDHEHDPIHCVTLFVAELGEEGGEACITHVCLFGVMFCVSGGSSEPAAGECECVIETVTRQYDMAGPAPGAPAVGSFDETFTDARSGGTIRVRLDGVSGGQPLTGCVPPDGTSPIQVAGGNSLDLSWCSLGSPHTVQVRIDANLPGPGSTPQLECSEGGDLTMRHDSAVTGPGLLILGWSQVQAVSASGGFSTSVNAGDTGTNAPAVFDWAAGATTGTIDITLTEPSGQMRISMIAEESEAVEICDGVAVNEHGVEVPVP